MHWHIRDTYGDRWPGHYETAEKADEAVEWFIESGQAGEGELVVFSRSVPTYHGHCS